MTGVRVQHVVIGQHADDDDRARHRERDAEYKRPPSLVHPSEDASHVPRSVAITLWPDRARYGDGAHRQQLLDMKLQADPEHQQDHADLGELFRHRGIDGEPGSIRAEERAGEQIADNRGQAQRAESCSPAAARPQNPAVSVRIRSYSCTVRALV